MDDLEDISDDNNESAVEKEEGVVLSDESQPATLEIMDSSDVVTSSTLFTDNTLEMTSEGVINTENCNKDGGDDDSSKGDNTESTQKMISMCKFKILSCEDMNLKLTT